MGVLRGAALAFGFTWGLAGACPAGPVRFVVAEPAGLVEHGDSFVLPLTDPADVAHARDLIRLGPEAAGEPIVFAEVRPGADGINRDVLANGQPLWDWHVSAFEGFGDSGVELVDGWPSFVQQDVGGWMANTRRDPDDPDAPGHIGFWNYMVVAELDADGTPLPPPVGVPLPPGAYAGGLLLVGLVCGAEVRRRRAASVG